MSRAERSAMDSTADSAEHGAVETAMARAERTGRGVERIERGTERAAVQLRLLDREERPDWVLDPKTRRLGRSGVAEAREILRRARPPRPPHQRDRLAS